MTIISIGLFAQGRLNRKRNRSNEKAELQRFCLSNFAKDTLHLVSLLIQPIVQHCLPMFLKPEKATQNSQNGYLECLSLMTTIGQKALRKDTKHTMRRANDHPQWGVALI